MNNIKINKIFDDEGNNLEDFVINYLKEYIKGYNLHS